MNANLFLAGPRPVVEENFYLIDYGGQQTPPPSPAVYLNERGIWGLSHAQAEANIRADGESLAQDFSNVLLTRSIDQVAHKGLGEFSFKSSLPSIVTTIFGVSATPPEARFTLGRMVHGIPTGRQMYADHNYITTRRCVEY
jgi:hypothetical protein